MKYTYLLVDVCALLIPLIFSFHRKIRFDRQWAAFFTGCLITGMLFLIWDSLFTRMNVWSFNPEYVIGIYLFGLPVEEILFFIFIPYSCVFTYYCLDKFFDLRWKQKTETVFCLLLVIALALTGIIYIDRWYTAVTFISTAIIIILLKFVARIDWFGKLVIVYAVLLVPFFIVNGILTGTGLQEAVVNYNNGENLGIRLLTIPVEDIVYGFELIMLNVFFFEMLRKPKREKVSSFSGVATNARVS